MEFPRFALISFIEDELLLSLVLGWQDLLLYLESLFISLIDILLFELVVLFIVNCFTVESELRSNRFLFVFSLWMPDLVSRIGSELFALDDIIDEKDCSDILILLLLF